MIVNKHVNCFSNWSLGLLYNMYYLLYIKICCFRFVHTYMDVRHFPIMTAGQYWHFGIVWCITISSKNNIFLILSVVNFWPQKHAQHSCYNVFFVLFVFVMHFLLPFLDNLFSPLPACQTENKRCKKYQSLSLHFFLIHLCSNVLNKYSNSYWIDAVAIIWHSMKVT